MSADFASKGWVIAGIGVLFVGCITGGPLFRDEVMRNYGSSSHGNHPEDVIEVGDNPRPSTPESLLNGKKLFGDYCAPCHGYAGDGRGEEAPNLTMKPADLRAIAGKKSDRHIFMQITLGGDGMAMWSNEFSEEDRWDLVNYVQSMAK